MYTPQYFSEPSQLTEGVHPAFLMAITDEVTPPNWESAKKNPRIYRWHFAVLHNVETMGQYHPELQTAVSSQIFSGGKQPSKNYTWHCTLIGHEIQPEEEVDLDPMMPVPCQLFIGRHDKTGKAIEYANIDKLYAWPDGYKVLTDATRQMLATWWRMKQAETPEPPAPAAQPPVPPVQAPPTPPAPPAYQPPVQQPLAAAPAPAPVPVSNGNGTPATPPPAAEKKGW
jgi:hypothetical protein